MAVRGRIYLATSTRTAAVPYESTPVSLHIHVVWAKPYLPYLTYANYHVYVPAVQSGSNELYNNNGDTHATIKVNAQSEHEPYWSNGDRYESITYHTSYITYHPVPSVHNVLSGIINNPKNGHSGIEIARISHFSPHFFITMRNGIQVGIFLDSSLPYRG